MADQWLLNEMGDEKTSFKAHEKENLLGGRFVQLSIFNLNHLNTAYMKGGNGNTVAYCGFLPLMSSAAKTLVWLYVTFRVWTLCFVNTVYVFMS